jgi:type IV pilus assembly protein PilW
VDYPGWSNTNQSGGVVYNLGQAPAVIDYTIVSGQLVHQNWLTSGTASAIMDGIVQLQAQYGRDTSGTADGKVDVWDTTQPADFDGWSRVLALRVGIVARSSLREKADLATGICNTTTTAPTWAGGTFKMTADADWKCYRYRVFETIIPIRNTIWFPIT